MGGGRLLLIIDLFLNVAYAVVNNESCHAVFPSHSSVVHRQFCIERVARAFCDRLQRF